AGGGLCRARACQRGDRRRNSRRASQADDEAAPGSGRLDLPCGAHQRGEGPPVGSQVEIGGKMSRRGLIAQGLAGACLAVMVSGLWSAATEAAEADVVLRNGKIYTADKERSIRQAIAIKRNTIVAVGD